MGAGRRATLVDLPARRWLARFEVPLRTENPWRELNLAFVPIVAAGAAVLLRDLLSRRRRSLAEQGRTLPESEQRFPALIGSLAIATSVALASMMAFAPESYGAFATEDGPLEYGQFLVYTSTALVWLSVAVRSIGTGSWILPVAAMGVVGFAFAAGEEISWGQRILEFETPELLSANEQQEANLHNLASGVFNFFYMLFAFGALGVAHVVYPKARRLGEVFEVLRPRITVFVIYTAAVGFHSGYMYRFGLFMVSFSVLYYGYLFWTRRQIAWLIGGVSVLYVTGLSFLVEEGLGWGWYTIDEGRESFFAAALLVHALSVRRRLQAPGPKGILAGGP